MISLRRGILERTARRLTRWTPSHILPFLEIRIVDLMRADPVRNAIASDSVYVESMDPILMDGSGRPQILPDHFYVEGVVNRGTLYDSRSNHNDYNGHDDLVLTESSMHLLVHADFLRREHWQLE